MRILFATGMAFAACALVQCTPRLFNNDSGVKNATAAEGVKQVNPKAFNAFNIWRDGKGAEVLDYPQGYEVRDGSIEATAGIFYEHREAYWYNDGANSAPTAGASVAGDLLVYPPQEGRTLKLKFSPLSPSDMNHFDAVRYCGEKKLRLPTAQELFDFCTAKTAAGVNELRCSEKRLWSASVYSYQRDRAFSYRNSHNVEQFYGPRDHTAGVRCVGGE
jgi:hypothetical protein